MPKLTSERMLDLLYNKKLPQVYRDEDRKLAEQDEEHGYPLRRYLESLIEGGYCGSIEDIEKMMLLIDPLTVPEEFFPYLCESFGLPYFPDIDISYQRKFIANIGELIKRRGTFSSVHFLIKVLTGLNSELSYSEGVHQGQDGNYLFIDLLARDLDELNNIKTSMDVIGNFISTQIPYYIGPVFSSKLDTVIISSKSYSHSVITSSKSYTIRSYKEGN